MGAGVILVGLVSCYREGPLLLECVRSALAGCDMVGVFEGYAGDGEPWTTGEPSPLERVRELEPELSGRLVIRGGEWGSDAAKRSAMLEWARRRRGHRSMEPVWALWLDGDELLLWPELLRDHVHRADLESTGTGGVMLRLVELDGSVVACYGKLIRADRVRRYLHSSYQVELEPADASPSSRDKPGMVVALPNVPICGAGGMPVAPAEGVPTAEAQAEWLARCRPPLQGEPHLLHRSAMRHPDRGHRMHGDEAEWFPQATAEAGLEGVDAE